VKPSGEKPRWNGPGRSRILVVSEYSRFPGRERNPPMTKLSWTEQESANGGTKLVGTLPGHELARVEDESYYGGRPSGGPNAIVWDYGDGRWGWNFYPYLDGPMPGGGPWSGLADTREDALMILEEGYPDLEWFESAIQKKHLAESQPLLDCGHRCDHKRRGVIHKDAGFLPLADLKSALEAAAPHRTLGRAESISEDESEKLPLPYDDLRKAVSALDPCYELPTSEA
jgi:hypothetical protein